MSRFKVGDEVIVVKYPDVGFVGRRGTLQHVRGPLHTVVFEDWASSPVVFYESELEPSKDDLLETAKQLGLLDEPVAEQKAGVDDKRIEELEAKISELKHDLTNWRGNHGSVVKAKRKLQERYDDLFRAKALPTLQALGDLETLVQQLRPTRGNVLYEHAYHNACDDVIELIADLSNEIH